MDPHSARKLINALVILTILYLTSTATGSPFPTTSRLLSETNNASVVSLGPGEFDSGLPGNTDAGQWNFSSALGDTTAAAEIATAGASISSTRQGGLWNQDLTGKTLPSGTVSCRLPLRANQGSGTAGRIFMRMTVVTGAAGAYTTVANLLTTAITGETSHQAGQNGWRAHEGARITVTSTAANFNVTIATAFTPHTFQSGERLLIELGFGDADSTTDRTWRLDYNTANSFITIPTPVLAAINGTLSTTQAAQTSSATGLVVVGGTFASSAAPQTSALAVGVVVSGALASSMAPQVSALEGTVVGGEISGQMATAQAAQTSSIAGSVLVGGAMASQAAPQTSALAGAAIVSGTIATEQAAQVSTIEADVEQVYWESPDEAPCYLHQRITRSHSRMRRR